MGYARETTPFLDRLSRDGVVFENAVAAGVPTISSMTSVMTGAHSLASPEIGFDTQQREQVKSRRTLAETLSEVGYSTGACSPNPPASSYFGFDEGFDWFEDFLHPDRGAVEQLWHRVLDRSMHGARGATYLRLLRNLVQREEVLRPWESYYEDILAWRSRATEPYFLWVLLLEPHHPWLPPSNTRRWSSRGDVYRSFGHYWEMLSSDWEPSYSEREHQRLIDLYDDSIRHGDRFIEQLWHDLRDDDPVFVIHADHGEEFGEHGRYGHQPYLYDSLVHVPLVFANVGQRQTVSRPVSLRSLAKTIATIADAPEAFAGRDLLAEGNTGAQWVVSKVFANEGRRTAIRTEWAKYIHEADAAELYDLRYDPDEQVNVAEDRPADASAFAEIVEREIQTETERRSIREATSTLPGAL